MSDHDDKHKMHVDDVLLGTIILLAPPQVRNHVLSVIRRHVSIIAAERAQELMTTIDMSKGLLPFLEMSKRELCDGLKGPTDGTVDTEEDFLLDLVMKIVRGEIPVAVAHIDPLGGVEKMHTVNADPNAFAEPTKGCNCLRCKHIKDMENKGLRLKNNGTTVPFDRLN